MADSDKTKTGASRELLDAFYEMIADIRARGGDDIADQLLELYDTDEKKMRFAVMSAEQTAGRDAQGRRRGRGLVFSRHRGDANDTDTDTDDDSDSTSAAATTAHRQPTRVINPDLISKLLREIHSIAETMQFPFFTRFAAMDAREQLQQAREMLEDAGGDIDEVLQEMMKETIQPPSAAPRRGGAPIESFTNIIKDIVQFDGEDGLKLRVRFPGKKLNETVFSIGKDLADYLKGKAAKIPKDKQSRAIMALLNSVNFGKLRKSARDGTSQLFNKLMKMMKADTDVKGKGVIEDFAGMVAKFLQKKRKGLDPLESKFDLFDLLSSLAKDATTIYPEAAGGAQAGCPPGWAGIRNRQLLKNYKADKPNAPAPYAHCKSSKQKSYEARLKKEYARSKKEGKPFKENMSKRDRLAQLPIGFGAGVFSSAMDDISTHRRMLFGRGTSHQGEVGINSGHPAPVFDRPNIQHSEVGVGS